MMPRSSTPTSAELTTMVSLRVWRARSSSGGSP
jgi:hypothetical protein